LRWLLYFWKICARLVLDQFEDAGVDERLILKLIVKKYVGGRMWLTSQGVCFVELRLARVIAYLTQVVAAGIEFEGFYDDRDTNERSFSRISE
jgi:hypothetical protein